MNLNKNVLIGLAFLLGGVLSWALFGRNTGVDALGGGFITITTPDGTEGVVMKDGMINKRATTANLRTYNLSNKTLVTNATLDHVYTVADATLDSTINLVVFTATADSSVIFTIPTAPLYEQQITLSVDYTASNKLYLIGGIVDSIASDQTRIYWYDLGNTTWRNVTL